MWMIKKNIPTRKFLNEILNGFFDLLPNIILLNDFLTNLKIPCSDEDCFIFICDEDVKKQRKFRKHILEFRKVIVISQWIAH